MLENESYFDVFRDTLKAKRDKMITLNMHLVSINMDQSKDACEQIYIYISIEFCRNYMIFLTNIQNYINNFIWVTN